MAVPMRPALAVRVKSKLVFLLPVTGALTDQATSTA